MTYFESSAPPFNKEINKIDWRDGAGISVNSGTLYTYVVYHHIAIKFQLIGYLNIERSK